MPKEKSPKKINKKKKGKQETNKDEKVFLYLMFLGLMALLIVILLPYFGVIVVSYIYCLLTFPIYARLNKRLPGWLSIFLTLLITLLIILTPIVILVMASVSEISEIIGSIPQSFSSSAIGESIKELEHSIETTISTFGQEVDIDIEKISSTLLEGARDFIANILKSITGSIGGFFISIILMFFLILYMLPNIESSSRSVTALLPINKALAEDYVRRTNLLIRDTFRASVITAIVQGTAGGMLLAIVGVPYTLFWTFLMMIFSALPIVGTSFVMIPIAIIYMLTGQFVAGLIILLWQMIVVGSIDNFLRPRLISKENKLNEIALLVTIIGGIAVFGIMGVFYGPIIYMLLTTTVRVLKEES